MEPQNLVAEQVLNALRGVSNAKDSLGVHSSLRKLRFESAGTGDFFSS